MSFDEAHPHGHALSGTIVTLFYCNIMCNMCVAVVCGLATNYVCVRTTPTETQLARYMNTYPNQNTQLVALFSTIFTQEAQQIATTHDSYTG